MSENHSSNEWRELDEYPGYRVNALGEVQSCLYRGEWTPIKPTPAGSGYLRFGVSVDGKRRNMYVHAFVLMAFVGPRPNGAEARHLDGNKTNNTLSNLAWGTKQENAADSVRLGVIVRGAAHKRAVVNEEQVREIKARLRAGDRVVDIARSFGLRPNTVTQIKNGYSWGHIE